MLEARQSRSVHPELVHKVALAVSPVACTTLRASVALQTEDSI